MTPVCVGALHDQLTKALGGADDARLERLGDAQPTTRRDRFTTLLTIYDLHTGPVDRLGGAVRFQHHPTVAALKQRCEASWLAELADIELPQELTPADPVTATRRLAAKDRLPIVYRWLAETAGWADVVRFLTLEGGPDAGFDDLVAVCQIGLAGRAKLELATNYWDEMGNGELAEVHTVLHERFAHAVQMPTLRPEDLPVSALERAALGGLLATNRWLQPEMLGALGLVELQAGPRCQLVLQAFDRCGAPSDAYPFYRVHAQVDPRHGKDWLDKAIAPTVDEHPEWADRIVRGALWRSATNAAFLTEVTELLGAQATPRGCSIAATTAA